MDSYWARLFLENLICFGPIWLSLTEGRLISRDLDEIYAIPTSSGPKAFTDDGAAGGFHSDCQAVFTLSISFSLRSVSPRLPTLA